MNYVKDREKAEIKPQKILVGQNFDSVFCFDFYFRFAIEKDGGNEEKIWGKRGS